MNPNKNTSKQGASKQNKQIKTNNRRKLQPSGSVQPVRKQNREKVAFQNNYQKKRRSINTNRRAKPTPPIKISFLGGLNEIGKNITLFECNDDIIILDCGMAFPDVDMLGVDLVIPDFTYILENKDKVRGIVLTHGHEDHIGSLPYLLNQLRVPVYGTALTIGLVANKLKEHNILNSCELIVSKAGDKIPFGCITAELIHVNHSIPDAVAVAFHTPGGTIVHTGDFKIDCTPTTDAMIDLARFASLGQEGVLALLADSTNAERPGYTMTEQTVRQSFENLFARAEDNRIIIATFASNISRVQQIINCAVKFGRKVAFTGRSMLNYISTAAELGYLKVPEGVIVDIDVLNSMPREKTVLVSTGSQGEPMSALYRMAFCDHKKIAVGAGDFIIISANPIPGNEKTVGTVVDELLKRGCEVVYESMYEVHVSGHACREELKIINALTRPKYFIPVHGEQKHLRKHAELAKSMGIPSENIFIGDVGSVIELTNTSIKELAPVTAGNVFVDGLGVGDVGSIVLRDRKLLSEDGIIIIVATLDMDNYEILSGPDIVSRGFVYVKESVDLLDSIKAEASKQINLLLRAHQRDRNGLKTRIKDAVSRRINEQTGRNPIILPILMEL